MNQPCPHCGTIDGPLICDGCERDICESCAWFVGDKILCGRCARAGGNKVIHVEKIELDDDMRQRLTADVKAIR